MTCKVMFWLEFFADDKKVVSGLVGKPEDLFSHNEAHYKSTEVDPCYSAIFSM